MCTFVGRGILAAWANNAQCIGMDMGDKMAVRYGTVRKTGGDYTLSHKQAGNLKSDNLTLMRACVLAHLVGLIPIRAQYRRSDAREKATCLPRAGGTRLEPRIRARYMGCVIRMSRLAWPWWPAPGEPRATRRTPDIAGEPARNFRRDETKLWGRQSEPHLHDH